MNRPLLYSFLFLFGSCQLPAEKRAEKMEQRMSDNTQIQTTDTNLAVDTVPLPLPVTVEQKIKNPAGIYHVSLPMEGGMEHTVAFYSNNTYQLQEKHKGDSVVIVKGTWSPSNGYIWLYKDQVVRARYKWSGDALQYFSPLLKKNFVMQHLQDALQNKVWQNKKDEGILVFGIGNEPFWSVEVNNKDSISFSIPDLGIPLRLKIASAEIAKDSSVFVAQNDSATLRITILPYFCSDGMSDFVYKNRIRVQYNNKMYTGCGINYQ